MARHKAFIGFLKLNYQTSFIEVLFGIFAGGNLIMFMTPEGWIRVVLLFITSHLLLYGGLYTLNDLYDADADAKHEHRRHRPIPAGIISKPEAFIYAAVLISAGTVLSYVIFGPTVFLIHLLFVFFNLFYTFIAKHVPFVEIFANSVTHVLRVMLGVVFSAGFITGWFAVAYYALLVALACVVREIMKEFKGSSYRHGFVLYTHERLNAVKIAAFCTALIAFIIDRPIYFAPYIIMLAYFVFVVFTPSYIPHFRSFFRKVYLMR